MSSLIRYEVVCPSDVVLEATTVLHSAWASPSMHYSPSYLAWQFAFPGHTRLAVLATDETGPVGFAAAVPRTVRFSERILDAAVVSFVAVRPDMQKRGIVQEIYRLLLTEVGQICDLVVTYGIVNSIGQRVIESVYGHAGYEGRSLGGFPVYCGLAKRTNVRELNVSMSMETCSGTAALLSTIKCQKPTKISNAPSKEQVAHYFKDPRTRVFFRIEKRGVLHAVASAVLNEVRTSAGIVTNPLVDLVWPIRCEPWLIAALINSAAELFDTGIDPINAVSIVLPELLGPRELRDYGVRAVGSPFTGYAFSKAQLWKSTGGGPLFCNLEVI